MKKGKRLLTILFAALALCLMGTAASFAATGDVTETHSGNTYTFTYEISPNEYESRTFKFSAPDQEYDGDGYDRGADFTPTQTGGYDFYLRIGAEKKKNKCIKKVYTFIRVLTNDDFKRRYYEEVLVNEKKHRKERS